MFNLWQMAYTRRRKGYRKRSRKLSNYNIATKTSAKAQSRQIYALKKRINYIQRLTKPEIKIQQRVASALTLTSLDRSAIAFPLLTAAEHNIYPTVLAANTVSENYQAGDPNSTSNSAEALVGPNRFARARSIVFYGNWQYSTIAATNTPLTLRIVIVQTRTTRASELEADDVFTSGNISGEGFAAVYGPLQSGLARTCKVLSDKRYQLNYQRPNVSIQTRLHYLSNFYRDANEYNSSQLGSETTPKGAIVVLYALYSPAATISSSSLSLMYKLAYTDA